MLLPSLIGTGNWQKKMARARLFCFGLGYSARMLAQRLNARGWPVAGTMRDVAAMAEKDACAIERIAFGGAAPMGEKGRRLLARATHLLSSVPPDGGGDPVLRHHRDDIARNGTLRWVGYLSTTGVYGDRGGAWVDEESDLRPATERGARRLGAEREWLALHERVGLPVHIFRLAGIYGPGRNAFTALAAGRARRIDKPGQVFSRIHVEDIATILEASIAAPRPGRVYNVCDDEPAPSEAVTAHAAALMGVAPPPLVRVEDADLSPMARSFYADNKRVSNARIKQELGVTLRYPDFRSGLASLLESEGRR